MFTFYIYCQKIPSSNFFKKLSAELFSGDFIEEIKKKIHWAPGPVPHCPSNNLPCILAEQSRDASHIL